MDRLWFEHRWPYLRTLRVPEVFVRVKCDCNVKRKDDRDSWATFEHFHKPGLSDTRGQLYGGNSGVCAINLAYQRMQKGDNLFLLGFDMQRGLGNESYWYPPYPWTCSGGATTGGKFKEWLQQFGPIGEKIRELGAQVFNVTHRSAIPHEVIPKASIHEMWEIVQ